MLPPFSGVATSQTSQVLNGQVQLGEINGDQTLNVVTQSDFTAATTTVVGNAFTASTASGSLDVRSNQDVEAPLNGLTIVNGSSDIGAVTSATTTVVGNAATSNISGGGNLTGVYNQNVGPVLIKSGTGVHAADAIAYDVDNVTSVTANTVGLGADGSAIGALVNQSSQANTQASGSTILKYVADAANGTTTAISNNVTANGADGSAQRLVLNQSMTGEMTQAAQFPQIGTGQSVTGTATAAANNASVSNNGGLLDVTTNQTNTGYVRAQTDSSAYSFGTNTAQAYGVGNSVLAQEVGDALVLDNTQANSGAGMQVFANASGNDGYDLAATATAMGNAVTGFACTLCGGQMTVSNSQTNSAALGAHATMSTTGSSRSMTGVTTAVGNSATFYVSNPGG